MYDGVRSDSRATPNNRSRRTTKRPARPFQAGATVRPGGDAMAWGGRPPASSPGAMPVGFGGWTSGALGAAEAAGTVSAVTVPAGPGEAGVGGAVGSGAAGAMVTWGITARAAWRSTTPMVTTAMPTAATAARMAGTIHLPPERGRTTLASLRVSLARAWAFSGTLSVAPLTETRIPLVMESALSCTPLELRGHRVGRLRAIRRDPSRGRA